MNGQEAGRTEELYWELVCDLIETAHKLEALGCMLGSLRQARLEFERALDVKNQLYEMGNTTLLCEAAEIEQMDLIEWINSVASPPEPVEVAGAS